MLQYLWNSKAEEDFFQTTLSKYASIEQLFYKLSNKYYAYIPKGFSSEGQTLQSRNSLIGHYTEQWVQKILSPIAQKFNLYAVSSVVCEEIGLSKQSNADLAFCTTEHTKQYPENIKLIFEIKMSIIWNYLFDKNKLINIGDCTQHKGNPSLLRSDSMLKAIGKSVNIRVSGKQAQNIPIIVLGNSPITLNYKDKVDFLKQAGIIQQFISLNPNLGKNTYVNNTEQLGFVTATDIEHLSALIHKILTKKLYFFSAMTSLIDLGKHIEIANQEVSYAQKAQKLLSLIRVN